MSKRTWESAQERAFDGYVDLMDGSSWPADQHRKAFESLREYASTVRRSADYLLGLTDEKRASGERSVREKLETMVKFTDDGDVVPAFPAAHALLAYRDAHDFHLERDASPAEAHERALEVMGWFLGRREASA